MSDRAFDEWVSGCNFEFRSTGQHKLEAAEFFQYWIEDNVRIGSCQPGLHT